MALTGDPVPAPDTEPAPLATDARPDHEIVLPAAAEVTGPVDRRPAQETTPATEPEPVPTAPAEPEVAPVPVAVSSGHPEPADAPAEPEPVSATPAEPATAATPVEPATAATPAEPVTAATAVDPATAADVPAEPESPPADQPADTPAVPVVVPSPRGEVAPATTGSEAADDFRRIQGVGPKMAAALQAAGIRTYRQLAELDEAALRETIRAAGLRSTASLTTWPQQAKVLAGAPQEASTALPTPVGGTDV
ncbi:DUF4332 domain-containing protein [Micromonospora peucetia]